MKFNEWCDVNGLECVVGFEIIFVEFVVGFEVVVFKFVIVF